MPASEPRLNTSDPNKWFIYWNQDVPYQLWETYGRKRIRIKKYEDINRLKGKEREDYAKLMLDMWRYRLKVEKYSPFNEELKVVQHITYTNHQLDTEIEEVEKEIAENLKSNTSIVKALDLYLESRMARTKNEASISTHRSIVKWFTEFLQIESKLNITVSKITRQLISDALTWVQKTRQWGPTTYNTHVNHIMTFLNWLEKEEFITKNPASGKIDKQRAEVGKNTWYKKDIASNIKKLMLETDNQVIYNACAFTYHLCVRSQSELLKMKVADFDFQLKRVRFRKEVSKNGREAFRDFTPEFEAVAKSMKLHKKPGEWYVFGKMGVPSPVVAGKNTLSRLFKKIKDQCGLNDEYSIYGWKHTRVIHEMMKGTQPYDIQYLCRHQSLQETEKYMRGFDLSLRNIYDAADLNF